jgi:hypothetical protein
MGLQVSFWIVLFSPPMVVLEEREALEAQEILVELVQRAEQLVRLKLAKAVRVEMEAPEGMEAPGV